MLNEQELLAAYFVARFDELVSKEEYEDLRARPIVIEQEVDDATFFNKTKSPGYKE